MLHRKTTLCTNLTWEPILSQRVSTGVLELSIFALHQHQQHISAYFSKGAFKLHICSLFVSVTSHLPPSPFPLLPPIKKFSGGWCVSDADCYARSLTDLGSTSKLPAEAADPAGYCGSSFLSQDPTVNSNIYNFTDVYVPYCDGTSWTGGTLSTVQINATASVSYRGAYLRDALIDELVRNHGLASATEVIIGGCSAGGLTIYLNIDYLAGLIREAAGSSVKIRGLADAGFFLDHFNAAGQPSRTPLFQWGFDAWNSSWALNPACIADHAGTDAWMCIFAQYTAKYIQTPTFFLNSRFDTCQLNGCELNLPDANVGWEKMSPSSRTAAIAYAKDFDTALIVSGFSSAPQHGGWITSCLVHCDAGDASWIHTLAQPRTGNGNSLTPTAAFTAWYTGVNAGDGWWSDRSATPNLTLTC